MPVYEMATHLATSSPLTSSPFFIARFTSTNERIAPLIVPTTVDTFRRPFGFCAVTGPRPGRAFRTGSGDRARTGTEDTSAGFLAGNRSGLSLKTAAYSLLTCAALCSPYMLGKVTASRRNNAAPEHPAICAALFSLARSSLTLNSYGPAPGSSGSTPLLTLQDSNNCRSFPLSILARHASGPRTCIASIATVATLLSLGYRDTRLEGPFRDLGNDTPGYCRLRLMVCIPFLISFLHSGFHYSLQRHTAH